MPTVIMDDYYYILKVAVTASPDEIKKSFRRLALLRHPDKNKAIDAHEQFVKLNCAHDVLSDPARRREYDQTRPPKTTSNARPNGAFTSTGEAKARADDNNLAQQMTGLVRQKDYQATLVSDHNRKVKKCSIEVETLKAEQARDSKPPWSLWSYLPGVDSETSEQKSRRQRACIDRQAAITIKSSSFEALRREATRQQQILNTLESRIQKLNSELRERRAAEELRQRQDQERIRTAQQAQEQAKQAAAREHQRQQHERTQKAQQEEVERASRAHLARERARRDAELADFLRRESGQKQESNHHQKHHRAQEQSSNSFGSCRHRGWWTRIEGQQHCARCGVLCFKFLLKCPSCDMTACAGCRKDIQRVS